MFRYTFPFILLMAILSACGSAPNSGPQKVLATTGMVGDATAALLEGVAETEILMGPGVDPHLYKVSQGDMQKLSEAAVVVYNGFHLEGKMAEVLGKLSKQKPVIPFAENIPENRYQRAGDQPETIDPHIWMDIVSWSYGVNALADTLMGIYPEAKDKIESNKARYLRQLDSARNEVELLIKAIPAERKVLITSHDAFQYFGLAYGIEVKGLQGVSTVSEYGLRDVSDLVNFIVERRIPAVFIETSVSDKSIKAVLEGCAAKGFPVKIGGSLFSDAMGAQGTPEGTYAGMMIHNARTIHNALK
jgi:manganese/zinc/iron transport system substrate-binding protein